MQLSINELVEQWFEKDSFDGFSDQPDRPIWFGRCGPLYRLRKGYRAFINSAPVIYIGYNVTNDAFYLYGTRDVSSKEVIANKSVEFVLDQLVYESVIK